MSIGRPKKYDENLIKTVFYLPYSLRDVLDGEASSKDLSLNEYGISVFIASDKDLAKKLALTFKEMKGELSKMNKEVSKMNKEVSNLSVKSRNIGSFLFAELEEDPKTKLILDDIIDDLMPNFMVKFKENGKESFKPFVDLGFVRFSEKLLENNKFVKKELWVKSLIKKRLMDLTKK